MDNLYEPIKPKEFRGLDLKNNNESENQSAMDASDNAIDNSKINKPDEKIIADEIQEFDFKSIPQYFLILLQGKRRSGKSKILDHILNEISEQHKFDDVFLFSGTAGVQDEYWKFVPKENIHDTIDNEFINNLYEDRVKILEKYRKNSHNWDYPPNALIIFDDLLTDSKGKSIFYSRAVNKLFFAGRHAGISVCVITQHFKAVGTILRANLDLFVYFRTLKKDDRLSICNEYLCYNDDKELAKKGSDLMSEITADQYQAMILNNKESQFANKFSDYVFKYKAPKSTTQKFKLFDFDKDKQMKLSDVDDNILDLILRKPKMRRDEPLLINL